MTDTKGLQHLHDGNADGQTDAVLYGGARSALDIGSVRIGGELDEKTERKGCDDLEDGIKQGAKPPEPKLEFECFVESPEEGVFFALFDAPLEGFFYFASQRLNSSIWVDVPNIALLQGAFVACLYVFELY